MIAALLARSSFAVGDAAPAMDNAPSTDVPPLVPFGAMATVPALIESARARMLLSVSVPAPVLVRFRPVATSGPVIERLLADGLRRAQAPAREPGIYNHSRAYGFRARACRRAPE